MFALTQPPRIRELSYPGWGRLTEVGSHPLLFLVLWQPWTTKSNPRGVDWAPWLISAPCLENLFPQRSCHWLPRNRMKGCRSPVQTQNVQILGLWFWELQNCLQL